MTPMMKQYHEAKAACGDAMLMFRMGDFYELFLDDAVTAARVLGLTLTSRDKDSDNPTQMAGFPHHQLDQYLHKLIRAGYRAAVCEQVEDPKQAKGLVRREITRIVSAGTLTDDGLLDPREANYLACVVLPGGKEQDDANPLRGLVWKMNWNASARPRSCIAKTTPDSAPTRQPRGLGRRVRLGRSRPTRPAKPCANNSA